MAAWKIANENGVGGTGMHIAVASTTSADENAILNLGWGFEPVAVFASEDNGSGTLTPVDVTLVPTSTTGQFKVTGVTGSKVNVVVFSAPNSRY